MGRKERFKRRNASVRDHFLSLERKNPNWRFDALVKDTANTFYLAGRTIEAIIRREGTYQD